MQPESENPRPSGRGVVKSRRANLDKLAAGFRDRVAVGLHGLQLHLDRSADGLASCFPCGIADHADSWKIGHIGAPSAIVGDLIDDIILHGSSFPYFGLLENAAQDKRRHIVAFFARDRHFAELRWVFPLFVRSRLVHHVPAVVYEQSSDFSKLQSIMRR